MEENEKMSQQYVVFKKSIIIFCLRNSVLSLAMGVNQRNRHTQGFLMLEKNTCINMEGFLEILENEICL